MHPESLPPQRGEARASLAAGLFTFGIWDMLALVVPLYAVAVGMSVEQIGLIVAARSVLPAVLSVHGGILMDRWGIRRVLLWLALLIAVLPLLYPLTGWFALLILLQVVLGLATSLSMAAAQTWSMQASGGDTAALARFSLVSRVGTFVGPVMVGAIWDFFGAWAAFISIAVWAAGIVAAAARGAPQGCEHGGARPAAAPSTMYTLLPSWQAHRKAFALAAIPAVGFVLAVSFLRNCPGAIQGSFYVVYLGQAGLSGTLIGMLASIVEASGIVGALLATSVERRVRTHRLVIICLVLSITAIAVTPLIGHALVLLIIAAVVRGTAQGLSQPLIFSLLARAVPAAVHGATVGLRSSVSRLSSIITPAIMGVVAGAWGMTASFFVMGGIYVAASLMLAVFARAVLAGRKTGG